MESDVRAKMECTADDEVWADLREMVERIDNKHDMHDIYITEIFRYILWAHEGGDYVY